MTMKTILPVEILEIHSAVGICPYQIEATTTEDKYLYLRYRGGHLRVYVAEDEAASFRGNEELIFSEVIGEQYDGIETTDFLLHLNGVVIFPFGFKIDGMEPRVWLVLKNEKRIE